MTNLPSVNGSSPGDGSIRFAYWVPNVSGGLVISDIEQRTSWDIDYNIKLAQIAEKSGFDYALSQIRFTAGYGADNQHEPVIFSTALLRKPSASISSSPSCPALGIRPCWPSRSPPSITWPRGAFPSTS